MSRKKIKPGEVPPCPECGTSFGIKYGRTAAGSQIYKCKFDACGRQYSTENARGGSSPKGEKPMTAAERMKRYRRRKKARKSPP